MYGLYTKHFDCGNSIRYYRSRDCLRKQHGDEFYLINKEQLENQVAPFKEKLKKKPPGTYALTLDTGDVIEFEVAMKEYQATSRGHIGHYKSIRLLKAYKLYQDPPE